MFFYFIVKRDNFIGYSIFDEEHVKKDQNLALLYGDSIHCGSRPSLFDSDTFYPPV
jgi:hypothetical protein